MNNTMKKILLGISGIALVICLFLLVRIDSKVNKTPNVGGGGIQAGSYFSTTTAAAWPYAAVASTTKLIKNGAGILGSIVITSSAAGTIYVYDGTTTVSHNDYSTTTLAAFPASTAAGTYIFDVAATRGLIVETSNGISPIATITWQ